MEFKKTKKRLGKHYRRSRPWRTLILHLGKKGSDGKSSGKRSDVPKGLAPKLPIKRTDSVTHQAGLPTSLRELGEQLLNTDWQKIIITS